MCAKIPCFSQTPCTCYLALQFRRVMCPSMNVRDATGLIAEVREAMCPTAASAYDRRRAWLDFQLTSHIPLGVSVAFSIYMRFYELALLTALVVTCSIRYHRNKERICVAAYTDNAAASVLTLYGICQLFASPSTTVFLANASMALTIASTFVLSNTVRYSHLYPIIHPVGMHVVPALWCLNVATFQRPFIRL